MKIRFKIQFNVKSAQWYEILSEIAGFQLWSTQTSVYNKFNKITSDKKIWQCFFLDLVVPFFIFSH